MTFSPEQLAALDKIRSEWDLAEEDIKLAEQVCNDIIVPAVKELRYGGRRLIDLIQQVSANPSSPDAQKLLADAEFDCLRARHDAIDAAVSKIAIQLALMEEKLTLEVVLQVAPEYRQIALKVVEIKKKIRVSRKDRTNRVNIYAVIETADFPNLVDAYNAMRLSEPLMIRLAKRSRWRDFYGKWGFWIGVAGLGLALYLWKFPPNP
jgi:hypothetical protein